MKRIILAVIGLSMIANSVFAAPNDCIGQVGDVKQSLLSPHEFIANHGKCWRLMDGNSIEGTPLGIKVKALDNTLPDARGMFLRGMNHDDGADPYKKRKVGEAQQDDVMRHHHFLIDKHLSYDANARTNGVNGTNKGNYILTTPQITTSNSLKLCGGSASDECEPRHTNYETRPKNISVYIYAHTGEIRK